MKRRTLIQSISAAALIPTASLLSSTGKIFDPAADANSVYELRIYHCLEGKLPDLLKRFREHTTKLFEKHGMKNIAYWTPMDEAQKSNTLVYIIAHASREAATANWKAFQDDPDWKKARAESEKDGKLVASVKSEFLNATDYSPIK